MARVVPAPLDAEAARCLLDMARAEAEAGRGAGGGGAAEGPALGLMGLVGETLPFLFRGCFPELLRLLQDESEAVSVSALRVLAGAGAGAREALPGLQRSFRPALSALCVGGTRRQAKLAVQAMAALSGGWGGAAADGSRRSTPTDGPLTAVRPGASAPTLSLSLSCSPTLRASARSRKPLR